jgi:hypothetical protein
VATDLFEWNKKDFLLVVDYYSCFFEVAQLQSTTSNSVINKIKPMFARYGIPERVVSDNGPQYSSQEFKDFSKRYNFDHVTSSPYHPKSNGLAEKYVQVVKRIFEKARLDRQDPLLGILEYRSTPLDIGYSPAELLQGRLLRSVMPILPQRLEPKFIDHSVVRTKLETKRAHEKEYYDRTAKSLPTLTVGQSIHIQQKDKTWRPGTVLKRIGDRSFIVNSQGGFYRRNRQQLSHRSARFQSFDPSSESPTGDIEITRTDTGKSRTSPIRTSNAPHAQTQPLQSKLTDSSNDTTSATSNQTETRPYVSRYRRVIKRRVMFQCN